VKTIFSCLAMFLAVGWPAIAQSVGILYDDRHVYVSASPAGTEGGDVAILRGGKILVGLEALRSILGRLDASLSYDRRNESIHIRKSGSGLTFTLDARAPSRNGERLLVPLREVVERLGGYVDWDSVKHVAVVRFVAAAPPKIVKAEPTPFPTPPQLFVKVVPVVPVPAAEVAAPAPAPPPVPPPVGAEAPAEAAPPVTSSRIGFFNDAENRGVISPADKRRYGRYSYVLLSANDARASAFVADLLGVVVKNPGQRVAVGAPLPDSASENTLRWNAFFLPVVTGTSPIAIDQGNATVQTILAHYDFAKAADLLADYCDDVAYHQARPICSGQFTGPVVLTFLKPLPSPIVPAQYPRAFAYDFASAPPDQFGVALGTIEADIKLPDDVNDDAYLPPSLGIHVANVINYTMTTIFALAPKVRSFTDFAFQAESK
jgi:hypothetical protein